LAAAAGERSVTARLMWGQIDQSAALAELEAEWWELWSRCPAATPFQSPAWLLPWWNAFAPGRLCVVTGREAQRLVALATLYVEQGAYGARLLPLGASISDHHDMLLDPEFATSAGCGLASYLAQYGPIWQSWEMSELAPDAGALRLLAPPDCEDRVEISSACPVLRLPSNATIEAHASPRKRRDIHRARNRAGRRGSLEIIVADRNSALPMLENLIRLHGAQWRSRGATGVLVDSRVQRFHRGAIPRLLRAGLLRLCELRIADATAGVYYGLQHRECAFGYLTGFDPQYAFESPGTMLLEYALDWAVRDGAREFHFLRGREAYKYEWGAVDRWNQRRTFRRVAAHVIAS
jgi:CelD/BcsL family acetyltransferase involved in cellulose biosynthesis